MTRDTMPRLCNENITNLVGSVDLTTDDNNAGHQQQRHASTLHWFVFEHLPLGDLKQFLRRHHLATTTTNVAETTGGTLR